jgi:hypothetical protein
MSRFRLLSVFALGLVGVLAGAPRAATVGSTDGLGVSPLLFDAAAEVWGVIARPDNPIWPGWNASDTPILLYLPDRQDLLIGHPHPPRGFVPYRGPLRFPGDAPIWVRNDSTLISLDGQNTSRDVAGVRALLEDPRPGIEKSRALKFEDIAVDPYDQLGLIVHEAFHVFQDRQAPQRKVNEGLVASYPVLSVDNNVDMGLEASALAAALAARDGAGFRAAAIRWLAVRDHRRALLKTRFCDYEDAVEFSEGMAKYTEYRLLEALEGRTPGPGIERAQGFEGYRDLAPRRQALLDQMKRHLRGEVSVNNAPYGVAPLRMRLYYSGMAIGAMLDRLSPTWKHDLFATDSSLTALVRISLHPTSDELSRAWKQALADTAYATLRAAKRRLAEDGRLDAERRVAAIEHGSGTGVEIDYSRLGSHQIGMRITPFGITAVDSVRTIFDQVPVGAMFPDGSQLQEALVLPLLRDNRRATMACRLEQTVSREDVERQLGPRRPTAGPGPVKLELPGLTLDLKRASLDWHEGTLRAVLFPDSAAAGGRVH